MRSGDLPKTPATRSHVSGNGPRAVNPAASTEAKADVIAAVLSRALQVRAGLEGLGEPALSCSAPLWPFGVTAISRHI